MNKIQLREKFTHQNSDESLSLMIKNTFFNQFDLSQVSKLHVFIPMPKEINTWLIINEIFKNYPDISVITSKSNLKLHTMKSLYLEAETSLAKNKWGVLEPVKAKKCQDQEIDMVLLPLLAFDKKGFRVGYGGGFYDRFLSECHPNILKIGLSRLKPVEKIDDINEYDVKMDYCIQSEKIWKFNA